MHAEFFSAAVDSNEEKKRRAVSSAPSATLPGSDGASRQQQRDRGLLHWCEVPPWLQFNPFVLSGYRRHTSSARATLATFFQWHNETVNIWTHLAPVFPWLYLLFFPAVPTTTYVLGVASVLGVFAASSYYHGFMCRCRNHDEYRSTICVDVLGSLISITTTAFSFLLYGNACPEGAMGRWIAAAFFLLSGLGCAGVILFSSMTVGRRFQLFGAHCVLRLVMSYWVMLPKYRLTGFSDALFYHSLSFLFLFLGGLFNISRYPERLFVKTRVVPVIAPGVAPSPKDDTGGDVATSPCAGGLAVCAGYHHQVPVSSSDTRALSNAEVHAALAASDAQHPLYILDPDYDTAADRIAEAQIRREEAGVPPGGSSPATVGVLSPTTTRAAQYQQALRARLPFFSTANLSVEIVDMSSSSTTSSFPAAPTQRAVAILRQRDPASSWIDYIGNSHNIWHVLSALSCWYTVVALQMDNSEYLRMQSRC
jgi:predicted membrane channel-forming protein YqfA (hemolysin III family)